MFDSVLHVPRAAHDRTYFSLNLRYTENSNVHSVFAVISYWYKVNIAENIDSECKSVGKIPFKEILFNPLLTGVHFLYPLKTPENPRFQYMNGVIYNENCRKSIKNWMHQVLKSGSSGQKVNVMVALRVNELRFT